MGKIPALISLVASLCPSASATAATWHVHGSVPASGDGLSWLTAFKTIQKGIDAASDADTVLVASGTYFENVHFHGKDIVLTSTGPLDPDIVATTIIDGNQSGSVVTFDGTENETCVLSGFTLTNGGGEWQPGGIRGDSTRATICKSIVTGNSGYYGGGLFKCNGSIWGNRITSNEADRDGGGLYGCVGEIRSNLIANNSCGGSGGGLALCQRTIVGNTISDNTADGDGGGLYSCDQAVLQNLIAGNHARTYGGGLAECDGRIGQNAIWGNASGSSGGGLYQCDGLIDRNWISDNSAGGCASWGAGLARCDGAIQNNLISHHRSYSGGSLFDECDGFIRQNTIVHNPLGGGWSWMFYSCWADITNCVVWDNPVRYGGTFYESSTPSYCCSQGWESGGQGNITEDPRFIDPDGPDDDPDTFRDNDYRLLPDSPCIDAGRNQDWMSEAFDLGGNPRILPGRSFLRVDMGAYEYVCKDFRVFMDTSDSEVCLVWISQPAQAYTVWSSGDLTTTHWHQEETVASQGISTHWIDPSPVVRSKFYRVELNP